MALCGSILPRGLRTSPGPSHKTIAQLSGGWRRRADLAKALVARPDVLILDEPTNHLDIDARDALVVALNTYKGAVILISHDRRLLELTVDRLWLIADGTVNPFNGDLDDYASWLKDKVKETAGNSVKKVKIDQSQMHHKTNKKEQRKAAADKRKATSDLRKKILELEKQITILSNKRDEVLGTLGDAETYEMSTSDLEQIIMKKEHIDRELKVVETEWLEASEALELAT